MFRFIERKYSGDTFKGYLVENDGMPMILSERDLYSQSIIEKAIETGYKYHDYYGNIESADGININELSKSQINADDNETFIGMFESDMLPESKALRYFTTDMGKLETIQFRDPESIKIHTREELVSYLRRFKEPSASRLTFRDYMPLNAICARDALFTPEELETNRECLELFNNIENRRCLSNIESVKLLQDKFISLGLMKEEDRSNIDKFIEAYFAWGPEGIKCSCIDRKVEYDVIYNSTTPYTGTGREKLTYDSIKQRVKSDLNIDVLSQLQYNMSYALMTKDGELYVGDNKVTRADIIEHDGDILLMQDDMKKYQQKLRKVNEWKGEYNVCSAIVIRHMNRLVFTMQAEDGRFYEYRADEDKVALVSMQSFISSGKFMSVVGSFGYRVNLPVVYNKKDFEQRYLFDKITDDIIDARKVMPKYASTSELCMKNGLHAEAALDYIQVKMGYVATSSALHSEFDKCFIDRFTTPGVDLEDMSYLDMLSMLLNNYSEALNSEDPEKYFNFEEIMANSTSANRDDLKLAIYIYNERPDLKIAALLDFGNDALQMEQLNGKILDESRANSNMVYGFLRTLYNKEYSGEFNQNTIAEFIDDLQNEKYCAISDIVPELNSEALGCLKDYSTLKFTQMSEANQALWVHGVIGEYSCAPAEQRRHLAFVATVMNMSKGTVIRKIIQRNTDAVRIAVNNSALVGDKVKYSTFCYIMSTFIDFLWGVRFKSINLVEEGDIKYMDRSIKDPFYGNPISARFEITVEEYFYITNPACEDFTIGYDMLNDFCRSTVSAQGSDFVFNTVMTNANISPWRILPKEGYAAVPVYTGGTNLLSANTWNTYMKENLTPMYNEVENAKGRFYVGTDCNGYPATIFDGVAGITRITPIDDMAAKVASIEFENANRAAGRTGNTLPMELRNYFVESDVTQESIKDYMARVNLTNKVINSTAPGKRLYRIALKSDYYYKYSASYYNEDIVDDYEVIESSYPTKISMPFGPISTDVEMANKIETRSTRIKRIDDVDITVDDLLRCTSLIKDGFSPMFNCVVFSDKIQFNDADYTIITVSDLTVNDLISYAANNVCYQLGRDKFMFYGTNGTFVVEVS